MTAIIPTLAGIGIKCRLVDGRLNLTPSHLVTDEVKKLVKANRDEIITALVKAEVGTNHTAEPISMQWAEPKPAPTAKPKKRQVSCRAFSLTGIHAVTRAELCLSRQGPHCESCEFRQEEDWGEEGSRMAAVGY